MNFSLALTNLLLSVSLSLSKADGPADWVRAKLEEGIALNGMGDAHEARQRYLSEYGVGFVDSEERRHLDEDPGFGLGCYNPAVRQCGCDPDECNLGLCEAKGGFWIEPAPGADPNQPAGGCSVESRCQEGEECPDATDPPETDPPETDPPETDAPTEITTEDTTEGDDDTPPSDPPKEVTLAQDFSYFVGDWYNCLHTSLMTFGGENAPKHVVEQVGCDGGLLGSVKRVGNNDQSMQMDVIILNHCFFHDLGGPGEPPCPDDLLDSDPRGPGNVLVKYQYFGIGSFAEPGVINMVSDHTFLKNKDGEWEANMNRAKIENQDTMRCQKYLDGIVCDWRINEYRTGQSDGGCLWRDKCRKNFTRKKCDNKGGEWSIDCGKEIPDGFVYDSFGSYYLVKDLSQCHVDCATASPTEADFTKSPELKVPGCYKGGRCEGRNGCCDCQMDEEDCTDGLWQEDGCRPICFDPPSDRPVDDD